MKLWEYLSSGLNVMYSNINLSESIDFIYKYNDKEDIIHVFDKAISNDRSASTDEGNIDKYSWEHKANALSKYFS
ncbi:Uncharacterised protein [Serratia quinivorans]|nr:Uncharacterised protein [Serratia quinivorans]